MGNERNIRMQMAYDENPGIGRGELAQIAEVTSDVARHFLEKVRFGMRFDVSEGAADPCANPTATVENKRLRQRVAEQQGIITELSQIGELFQVASERSLSLPSWLIESKGKSHHAIATAVLADPHFDEVVRPEEIGWVNAYNREIAQLRLREFFANTVKLGRDYFSGIKMEGLTLAMAGDIVAGNIHEELQQTNAAAILDTCLFWSEEIAAGIEHLSNFYGNIFCPCVVGNHGRQSRKPRHKGKVKDNFDYLIYSLVARHFRSNDKISFLIPDSSDAHYSIYNIKYCLTHGDQFRGGTGIAGALSPILLGDARKRKRSSATNKDYDYMVLGHWHQEIDTCGIIVCNTLKGYDEFASDCNFNFSEPSQAFWLTDSEKGRTLRAPIHVRSKGEKWGEVGEQSQPLWLRDEGAK